MINTADRDAKIGEKIEFLLGASDSRSRSHGITSIVKSLLEVPTIGENLTIISMVHEFVVDIMQATRELVLDRLPLCTESHNLIANAALLLSDIVIAMPHTSSLVADILLSVKLSARSGSSSGRHVLSDCLLSAAHASLSPSSSDTEYQLTSGWRYIWTLRCLTYANSLAFMSDGVDLGGVLQLAASRADEGRLMYHALQLFFEQVNAPNQFRLAYLEHHFANYRAHSIDGDLAALLHEEASMRAKLELTAPSTPSTAPTNTLSINPLGFNTVSLGSTSIAFVSRRSTTAAIPIPPMAPTPSSMLNMLALMDAYAMAVPVLIQGESGCGKTFLLRQLAAILGQRIVELHLDDQADSKALIGAFVCSDVPGEFLWQAGVVTQAAMQGHWLVVENVDKVPLDVVAALSTLLERRTLYLPQDAQEHACHPSFRIFASRTVQASSVQQNHSLAAVTVPQLRHFSQFFHVVSIITPPLIEIETIVATLFPMLLPIMRTLLMTTYARFSRRDFSVHSSRDGSASASNSEPSSDGAPHAHAIGLRLSREFTIRDVMKVSRRFCKHAHLFNVASDFITGDVRRLLLAEVVDVFAASVRDAHLLPPLVHALGSVWGVPAQEIDSLVLQALPQMNVSTVSVTVGRVVLDVAQDSSDTANGPPQQFAFTRHSLRLLEKLAQCVVLSEPVLLVGETGSGKTTSVQELAGLVSRRLHVQNLSLSTDSSDLLGGFRPVGMKTLFQPSYERFVDLFKSSFNITSAAGNAEYLSVCAAAFKKQQWGRLLRALKKACGNAVKKYQATDQEGDLASLEAWEELGLRIDRLIASLPKIEHGFAFAFVDGLLVEAMTQGHWVLLDEVNLASPEVLQGLVGILDGQSLCLTEKGDVVPVARHSEFRLFAAMNPPTDIGKKELPPSIRCRFTEIYSDELLDRVDLCAVVTRCLEGIADAPVDDIVSIYLGCREAAECKLVDNSGQRPRYTLRSLTRSLSATKKFLSLSFRPLSRALFEGLLLNFQTQLDERGRMFMYTFLKDALGVPGGKDLATPPSRPGGKKSSASEWVLVKPFWLRRGPLQEIDWCDKTAHGTSRFVMTKTVEASVRDLAAAVASGVAPILLQGPTSVGKTTMIEYLAARTGHRCIRINNHEHTDTQEYIGGYVTSSTGLLEFKDGLLVEALKGGHWIILDELNLAPSDVLEALNRLLDDNKELYIPETGETVRPAEGFTLFATQNPPGAYGGRKPLSRAFKNRFLELGVCDLPHCEVEEIISMSCGIAPKFSKMLVEVMADLALRRQQSTLFQGKYGSITTRDLIKWGKRQPQSAAAVCREGYMLLAERLRDDSEKAVVQSVLEKVCRAQLDLSILYEAVGSGAAQETSSKAARDGGGGGLLVGPGEGVDSGTAELLSLASLQTSLRDCSQSIDGVAGIAITMAMKRLWVLAARCVQHSEPVLLIGETGCGKTTVCQLLAARSNQPIKILNCHQSTESSDIIGGLRPVRNREALLSEAWAALSHVWEECSALAAEINQSFELSKGEAFDGALSGAKDLLAAHKDEAMAKAVKEQLQGVLKGLTELIQPASTMNEPDTDLPSLQKKMNKKAKTQGEFVAEPILRGVTEPHLHGQLALLAEQAAASLETASALLIRYGALFEWVDGPLVSAMKSGDIFVLDEINLADDAVIERLNSVLESSRSITLAEKGGSGGEADRIVAHPAFRLLATMNPGGDFGKRELSPALRSRFTEIWASTAQSQADFVLIIAEILRLPDAFESSSAQCSPLHMATIMVEFTTWLNAQALETGIGGAKASTREILAWAKFISITMSSSSALLVHQTPEEALYSSLLHGALMVILDGLGLGTTTDRSTIRSLVTLAVERLLAKCPDSCREQVSNSIAIPSTITCSSEAVAIGTFSVKRGSKAPPAADSLNSNRQNTYVLSAKSTLCNLTRIMRAMRIQRPILLEGPPGVGKSSIVANLATLSGHSLVRINLSEFSELSDLLGTDLPTVYDEAEDSEGSGGSKGGAKFTWCDGVFLTAMKEGAWVLLDELNLAPQTVLEGLNACFDHREEVYLPEIGQVVRPGNGFRVFCAQNPMVEGGGRKGLPASFLSRFSRVYVEAMGEDDMKEIATAAFIGGGSEMTSGGPSETASAPLPALIPRMVKFIRRLQDDMVGRCAYGRAGAPWEFNLRDVFRWLEMASLHDSRKQISYRCMPTEDLVAHSAYVLFVQRMREEGDREAVAAAFAEEMGYPLATDLTPLRITLAAEDQGALLIGQVELAVRSVSHFREKKPFETSVCLEAGLPKVAESLAFAVRLSYPVLMVGPTGSGKKSALRALSRLTGNPLMEFCVTASTDSAELLGSFEQASGAKWLSHGLGCLEEVALAFCGPALVGVSASCVDGIASNAPFQAIRNSLTLLHQTKQEVKRVMAQNLLHLADGLALFTTLQGLLSSMSDTAASAYSSSNLGGDAYSSVNQALSKAAASLTRAYRCTTTSSAQGFIWTDGVIVRAVEQGYWLLVDNVNLCSASVLDRLNSLLEPNGTLLLTEGGEGRELKPHKNFRIFFAMDPTYGEISRAMRNRCMELAIGGGLAPLQMLTQKGPRDDRGSTMDSFLLQLHHKLVNTRTPAIARTMVKTLQMQRYFLWTGCSSAVALNKAVAATCSWAQMALPGLVDVAQGSADNSMEVEGGDEGGVSNSLNAHNVFLRTLVNLEDVGALPVHTLATLKLIILNIATPLLAPTERWALVVRVVMDAASMAALGSVLERQIAAITSSSASETPAAVTALLYMLASDLKLANATCRDLSRHMIALIAAQSSQVHAHSLLQQYDTACQVLWKAEFTDLLGGRGLGPLPGAVSKAACSLLSSTAIAHCRHAGAPWEELGLDLLRTLALHQAPITHLLQQHLVHCHTMHQQTQQSSINVSLAQCPSLAVAGCWVSGGVLVADSPELLVAAQFYDLAMGVSQLVLGVGVGAAKEYARTGESSPSVAVHLLHQVCPHLATIINRHAVLVNILCQPSMDLAALPWGELVVAMRWLQKSLYRIKTILALDSFATLEILPTLTTLTLSVDSVQQRAVKAVNTYFNVTLSFTKVRLWKEGGHPAVPGKNIDWELLLLLRSVVNELPSKQVLASMVDAPVATNPFDGLASQSLLQDWLALYATFYYSSTPEGVTSGVSRPTGLRIKPLAKALLERANHITTDITDMDATAEEEDMDMEEDEGRTRFRSHARLQMTIDREEQLCVAQPLSILAERIVIEAFEKAISLLSELVMSATLSASMITDISHPPQSHSTVSRLLRRVHVTLQRILVLSIRTGCVDPLALREIQSLQWCIESQGQERASGESASGREELFLLARSVLPSLDTSLHALTLRSLNNNIEAISFSYSSPTLVSMLATRQAQQSVSVAAVPFLGLALSGPVRSLQPVALETALSFIDVAALLPKLVAKGVLKVTGHRSAKVTVKACTSAKRSLLQLFRMTVLTADPVSPTDTTSTMYDNADVACISRLPYLCLMAVDIVTSCRDLYDDAEPVLAAAQVVGDPASTCQILADLKLHTRISSQTSAVLFQTLLQPALELLAKECAHMGARKGAALLGDTDATHTIAARGQAWIQLSLLRLHLLLPPLPVDPATKPATKTHLLLTHVSTQECNLFQQAAASALSLEPIRSAPVEVLSQQAAAQRGVVEKLSKRVIERPSDAAPFADLYRLLVDGCSSVGEVSRVLLLAEELRAALQSLLAPPIRSPSASNSKNIERAEHLLRQEATWQASGVAFFDRVRSREHAAYEDVTGSLQSALAGVSRGLRMMAAVVADAIGRVSVERRGVGEEGQGSVQRAWKGILSYPHSAALTLERAPSQSPCSSSITLNATKQLLDLLQYSESAAVHAAQQSVSIVSAGGTAPPSELINTHSLSQILLLALAKIDYLVGGGTVQPAEVSGLFQKVLLRFVESHAQAEEDRKHKLAVEGALFRNRTQESTFEANDEKEETAALRMHFPDHLKAFRDVLASNSSMAGAVDPSIGTDAAAALEKSEAEEGEDAQGLDSFTTSTLIGFHARMVFVHTPHAMQAARLVWTPSSSVEIRSSLRDITKGLHPPVVRSNEAARGKRLALTKALSLQSLVVSKCLDLSGRRLLAPGLAFALNGGCLLALSEMSLCISPTVHSAVVHAPSKVKGKKVSFGEEEQPSIDRDMLLLLQNAGEPGAATIRPIDFHRDANASEAALAAPAIEGVFRRGLYLLTLYPGNEIIEQVCLIAGRILEFHVSTPLGKLLVSVELLLRQVQEWESYAARHVSMDEQVAPLRKLIAQWREMELRSWEQLLRCKEVEYATAATSYWFLLVRTLLAPPELAPEVEEATVRLNGAGKGRASSIIGSSPSWLLYGTQRSSQPPNVPAAENTHKGPLTGQEYLRSVFGIIDGFLSGCNTGQFPTRLHLVRLLALQLQQESALAATNESASRRIFKQRVAHLTLGLWQYYNQFLPLLRTFQDTLRAPILTKLRDEMKISKWDAMTTYALIEHSERIHRKLNKLIREYQGDVLEYPVSALLQRDIMGSLASNTGELVASVSVPSLGEMFPKFGVVDDACGHGRDGSVSARTSISLSTDVAVGSSLEGQDASYLRLLKAPALATKAAKYLRAIFVVPLPEQAEVEAPAVLKGKEKKTAQVADEGREEVAEKEADADDDESDEPNEPAHELYMQKTRFGPLAAEIADHLCSLVFARIQRLKSPEIPKSVKHRAVTDLLRELRRQGISSLRNSLPAEIRDMAAVLTVGAPMACEQASHLTPSNAASTSSASGKDASKNDSSMSGTVASAFGRGEQYYLRNVVELNQLRAQAVSPSAHDVSHREIAVMVGLGENMFVTATRLRVVLGASLQDCARLHGVVSALSRSAATSSNRDSGADEDVLPERFVRQAVSVLLDSALQLHSLLLTALEAHAAQNVEESPAIAPLDGNQCSVAVSAAARVVEIIEGMLVNIDSPSSARDLEAVSPSASEEMFGYHLPPVSGVMVSKSLCQRLSASLEGAQKSLIDQAGSIMAMVGSSVFGAVGEQMRQLEETLCLAVSDAAPTSLPLPLPTSTTIHSNTTASLAAAVDACLLAVQRLKALKLDGTAGFESRVKGLMAAAFGGAPTVDNEQPEQNDSDCPSLQACLYAAVTALTALDISSITSSLTAVLPSTSTSSRLAMSPAEVALIQSSLPIIQVMQAALRVLLDDLALAYKAGNKLCYVVLRVFRVLLAKGLCSDDTKDQEGEGDASNMTFSDDNDGTGMGEGEGKKDVSDQIDNEDQLLGLKGDEEKPEEQSEPPSKPLSEEEKDTGVEMAQDFDGEMHDLPPEGEREEKEQDDDEEDEGEELDREMGEADDAEVVDEKAWDSDEDERDEGKEQFENDSKMKGETIEGESHTKDEEEGKEASNEENDQGDEDKKKEPEKEDAGADEGDGKINEDNDDDHVDKPQGIDVREEEGEDGDEGEEGDGGEGDDREAGDDEAGKDDDGGDLPDDMQIDGEDDGEDDGDAGDVANEELGEEEQVDEQTPEEEPSSPEDEDSSDVNKDTATGEGNTMDTDVPENETPPAQEGEEPQALDEEEEVAHEPSVSKPPAFGVKSGGKTEAVLGTETDEQTPDPDKPPEPNSAATDGPEGSGGTGTDQGSSGRNKDIGDSAANSNPNPMTTRPPPNPFKQRGDLNKEWHRRLQMTDPDDAAGSLGEDQPEDSTDPDPTDSRGQFEFQRDEDPSEGMQVLSDVREEEAVSLPQNDQEPREESDLPPGKDLMDDAQPEEQDKKRDRAPKDEGQRKRRRDEGTEPKYPPASHDDAKETGEVDSAEQAGDGSESADPDAQDAAADTDEYLPKIHTAVQTRSQRAPRATVTEPEENSDNADSLLLVQSPSGQGEISLAHRDLWTFHRLQTDALSLRLCEQLRLILAPTLTTRLQGDYRTGKRISMRKVISYIASGFRKDKIWLRRTKPAKRAYQVMMMIDDSSSMGAAGPLALSALATISMALTRLEVGELAVCSFAENVSLLHPFGQPLTEDAGAKVMGSFSFTAGRTMLGASLRAVQDVFSAARQSSTGGSSGATNVLQLCFVVSDARIDSDNREVLDATVRTLAEQNILVVLIIIDKNADAKDSIFNTRSVEFRGDRVVTSAYLDNFPFPYYIAIQKLEAMPDVLCEALKGWFELINSQLEG